MHGLVRDLRYSLRQFINAPGFALTAIVSLALGIGATTAVFSVIYAALVNPFPYTDANRIVRLTIQSNAGPHQPVNLDAQQIRQLQQSPVVASVLAMDYHAMSITGPDFPENVNALGLISNGFRDLGMATSLGRGLLPSDNIDGHPQPVTVLSYKFWQKHFFGNPDVLGKTIELDHQKYIVVGVVAPRFTWYSPEVYLPLDLTTDPTRQDIIDIRLKSGVSYRAADSALQPVLDQFAKQMPKQYPKQFRVQVEGLNDWVDRSIGGTLYLLLGAVGLLLGIGCGNVSILLLARGTARQHELALRSAMGAGRARIMRQLLSESMLLAIVGAILGVALSYSILAAMRIVLPRYAFAPEVEIRINLPILLFSVGIALATGILFGLWPALQLSRTHLEEALRTNTRRLAGSVRGRRTHAVLIGCQIALTMLLLAGAGSAMKGFLRVLHAPLGYDPHNVMSVPIPLRDNSYTTWAARAVYLEQLRFEIANTPGVTAAAISSNATPPRNGSFARWELMGKQMPDDSRASVNLVSAEYFPTLRIPLIQGRLWTQNEIRHGAHVAVVNATLVHQYFPDGDAIGHSLKLPALENRPPSILTAPNIADSWLIIIGIVADARNDGLEKPVRPGIYIPFTLNMYPGTQVLVRSVASPLTLVHAIRTRLAKANPDQQTYPPETLDSWLSDEPEWQQERLAAWIFGFFASLALTLAAIGLYSVVAYTVAQRTGEFGIRMALGAQPGHVLRAVFASTLVNVGVGIGAGLVLAVVLSAVLEKWAGGSARDPLTLLAGSVVLAAVSAVACAIPARRAAAVDPMTALRTE